METNESDKGSKQIASVKEAISFYGERITRGKEDVRRLQVSSSEKTPKERELHIAKRDIHRFNESSNVSDHRKSQAEMELLRARNTVKDLTLKIEESKLKARENKSELETLTRSESRRDSYKVDDLQYAEVMRELKIVKQELCKLKLDMAYLSDMKLLADKEAEASNMRIRSYASSIEELKKEIEEANEEQILVELAKIEAITEYEAIEAERAANATNFLSTIGQTKRRTEEVIRQIESSKELEEKLANVNSDVDILQNELQLVRRRRSYSPVEEQRQETETLSLLDSVKAELKAANAELASIKEEGFQFMASMDIVRDELKHVSEETAHLKKLEEKADSTVQNLNSKLIRAKLKLEAVISAEEKAKAIVSNLSATLQQLATEAEAAKKERELVTQESNTIIEEKRKTKTEIELAEEELKVALEELEAVKASEAIALDSLKNLSERTMKARASASEHNSSITISQFEYKYLHGRAEGVEEIVDKKVAAAQAWIEALKASEKEILMKTEIMLKEMRAVKVIEDQEGYRQEKDQGGYRQEKDQEGYRQEKPRSVKTSVENEPRKPRHHGLKLKNEEKLQIEVTFPRTSVKDNGNNLVPLRKAYPRRNSTHGARHLAQSNSVTLKKRTKVMPNLGKFFGNKAPE